MNSAASLQRSENWPRSDGIDFLRGVAIFFVLMNHVNMRLVLADIPYGASLPKWLLNALVWNGQRGVQIFFAISGFLITSTSLRRWGQLSRVRVRDFYLLRFARIAPPLFVLLGVLSILHFLHFENFVVPGGLLPALFAALTFRVNLLLRAHSGHFPGNWYVLWSLSVEEMFYLFFPLICWLLGRGKTLFAVLCTFVVLGPFARTIFANHSEVWQEVSYLGGMDAIALGCLTAILLPRLCFGKRVLACMQWIGVLLIIFSLRVSNNLLVRSGLDMTLIACGTCLVLAAVSQTDRAGTWITRPVLWLGQRSYEVYLTHMFVVYGLFGLYIALGTPAAGIPILFLAVVILAAVLGEMVARFFSEPVNRSLRYRWGDGPNKLGSVVEQDSSGQREPQAAA